MYLIICFKPYFYNTLICKNCSDEPTTPHPSSSRLFFTIWSFVCFRYEVQFHFVIYVHFCDLICVTIINEKKRNTKYFKKTKQKKKKIKQIKANEKKNWLILWQQNILPWKYNTVFLVKKKNQSILACHWSMGNRYGELMAGYREWESRQAVTRFS